MVRTAAQEAAFANRMLGRADHYLAQVDDAYIIKQRGHTLRPMPTFRPEEISIGRELGRGGFGVVYEIKNFTLDAEETADTEEENNNNNSNHSHNNNPQDSAHGKASNDDAGAGTSANSTNGSLKSSVLSDFSETADDDTKHYNVHKARHLMATRVQRNGRPRYALKMLHGNLAQVEKARGMIDLALEAKYLSIVWHPNIIKMRGMGKGKMVDPGFFIILDRLEETLTKRMNRWVKDFRKYNVTFLGMCRNKKGLATLMLERLTVAYDLAAAFMYLHENRLVYRDIKPENIGFDVRGDVKVFDFGLCKTLSSKLKARDGGYGYRLTGKAGSLPYMAPEVALMKTYDTKCDVYSFAILLWEMLACRAAFDKYTTVQFVDKVAVDKERLPIAKNWPPLTRLMLPEAWDDDPAKRPDMKRVAIVIRGDLNDLTTDDRVLHRTKHLQNRSQHSLDGGGDPADQNLEGFDRS